MPKFLVTPTSRDETVAKVHREDCPFAAVISRSWGVKSEAIEAKTEYNLLDLDGVSGFAPCLITKPKRGGSY